MAKSSRLAGAVLAPLLIAVAGAAAASEVRCVRGDDAVRRVAVDVEDPDQGVPCEVVYWKDTEQPGVRNVLWSAQTDAGFCARKAQELVETLEGGGWSCSARSKAPQAAAAPPQPAAEPGRPAEPASPKATPAPDMAHRMQPEASDAGPAAAAPSKAKPQVKEALAPPRAATPSAAATPPAAESPDTATVVTALDAIIEQNLVRLNDGVDGKFAAEIGDYGDLNDDGREDGLVFFTYESDKLGQARFIAAYLSDGDGYTLAATKPLAGSDDNVQSAEIQSIDNGVISLRLNVLEPGDAACCPSGTRRQNLMLRDGQLVEAAQSAAGTSGKS